VACLEKSWNTLLTARTQQAYERSVFNPASGITLPNIRRGLTDIQVERALRTISLSFFRRIQMSVEIFLQLLRIKGVAKA
jgi:hypothetical protein